MLFSCIVKCPLISSSYASLQRQVYFSTGRSDYFLSWFEKQRESREEGNTCTCNKEDGKRKYLAGRETQREVQERADVGSRGERESDSELNLKSYEKKSSHCNWIKVKSFVLSGEKKNKRFCFV